MAEWSIAAVLKTVEGHTSGGSNPSLSAKALNIQGFIFCLHLPNQAHGFTADTLYILSMKQYFETKNDLEDAVRKYARTPAGKRLRNISFAAIAACAALLITVALCINLLSWKIILLLRGCAGLCGIIFIIVYGLLLYKAHSSFRPPHKRRE